MPTDSTGPKQVTDIYLLSLAVANGGRLVTFDEGIPGLAVNEFQAQNIEVLDLVKQDGVPGRRAWVLAHGFAGLRFGFPGGAPTQAKTPKLHEFVPRSCRS